MQTPIFQVATNDMGSIHANLVSKDDNVAQELIEYCNVRHIKLTTAEFVAYIKRLAEMQDKHNEFYFIVETY